MRWFESAVLLLAVSSACLAEEEKKPLFSTKDFENDLAGGSKKWANGNLTLTKWNNTDLLLAEPFALSRVDVTVAKRYNLVRTRFTGGIDYHLENNELIWSEISTGRINARALNAHGRVVYLRNRLFERSPKVWRPRAIAVDFLANNLYVLDTKAEKVHVLDLNSNHSTVIYKGKLEEATDLALDPSEGVLYIANEKSILKMNMDGSNVETVVSYDHYNIKSVAVDLVQKRLYWSDESFHRVKSALYDGKNVTVALKNQSGKTYQLLGPANLAIRGDTLYFYDDMFRRISSIQVDPKSGLVDESTFKVVYDGVNVRSMKVMDERRKAAGQENPCKDNGGCDKMCLIASRSAGALTKKCA